MVSPQPQILLDGSIKDTVQQARVEILRWSPCSAYRLKMLQKCSLCSQFEEVKAKVEGHIRFNWCSLATSITNPHPHPYTQTTVVSCRGEVPRLIPLPIL